MNLSVLSIGFSRRARITTRALLLPLLTGAAALAPANPLNDLNGRSVSAVANVQALPPSPVPTLGCPSSIVSDCPRPLFTVFATDYLFNFWLAVCVPPSGTYFPLGQSTVVCTATDRFGSVGTCSFPVTIVPDTTPPEIICSRDMSVHTTNTAGALVEYFRLAFDDCFGPIDLTCSPPSGATFPIGLTPTVCTARDIAGNSNSCSFKVTVILDRPPIPVVWIGCSFPSMSHSQDSTAYVVALDEASSCVVLDGTGSSDPENLPLQFTWIIDGTNSLTGAIVTNCFDLGCHSVVLEVSSGQLTSRYETNLCVISASEAVEAMIALVDGSSVEGENLRPIIAILKAAAAAFERRDEIAGLNVLGAFRNKVAARIAPTASFIAADQPLLDGIHCAALSALRP